MENHEDQKLDKEFLDGLIDEYVWVYASSKDIDYLINKLKYFRDAPESERKKIEFEKTKMMLYKMYKNVTSSLPIYKMLGMDNWSFEKFCEFIEAEKYSDNPKKLIGKLDETIIKEFESRKEKQVNGTLIVQ